MQKVVAAFFSDDGELQFVGQDGTIMVVPVGSTTPTPLPGPNSDDYYWFRDGEGLKVMTGGVDLGHKIIEAQAVYRRGMFSGHVTLDKSAPAPGQGVKIVPTGNHLPWVNGGLADVGAVYGEGFYSDKGKHDFQPVLVKWEGYRLRFYAADPNDSDKWRSVKAGFPSGWQNYGLFLSWTVMVP